MNKKMYTKNIRGITLVALVVTIVVLLILAGITITYVMGDNSVFKQAQSAKEESEKAKLKEQIENCGASHVIAKQTNKSTTIQDLWDRLIKANIIASEEDKEGPEKDETGENDVYTLNTKNGYTVEIVVYPSGSVEVREVVKGTFPPIIRKVEASSTGDGLKAKAVVSRLKDGTVEYFYRLSTENDSEYKKMNYISETEGANIKITLQEGATYKVKVIAKNGVGEDEDFAEVTIGVKAKSITLSKTAESILPNGTLKLTATVLPENAENKEVEWSSSNPTVVTVDQEGNVTALAAGTADIKVKSTAVESVEAICKLTVKIPVESVTLNKPNAKVQPNGTFKLTVSINPSNATNKNVTWSSSNEAVATVSQTGMVTAAGVTSGTTTITVTSEDDSSKTASCVITVTDETDWAEIAEIAKLIANDTEVTSSTPEVTKNGTTIKVGQEFKVVYEGKARRVRVLGFKYDDLVDKTVYGGNHSKASITFEFLDCLGQNSMNSSSTTNTGGWAATPMRKWLNGYANGNDAQSGGIGGIAATLATNMGDNANSSGYKYIKQVKKQYIKTYNSASSNQNYTQDYLWLLSTSEIYPAEYRKYRCGCQ